VKKRRKSMHRIVFFKAPDRYEDIADFRTTRLRPFQKLRLLLFLAGHPDEAERYKSDWEAKWRRVFGGGYDAICADPEKKVEELRAGIGKLKKGIEDERWEQRELLARLESRERTLERVSGKEEVS
jgi:hypothetical protein